MKRFTFIVCISLLLMVLIAAVPVTATSTTITTTDSITTINPTAGQTGKTVTVTITGVNFTPNEGSVRLEKSGESDISGSSITISSWTYDTIVCKIKISSSRATGKWDVVIVKGIDSSTIVRSNGFAITEAMTLTSISPTSGQIDDDVDFTLAGTNLDDVEEVYLYLKGSDNITADSVDVTSSTKVKGTFDLSNADEGTYDVCVMDSYNVVKCDPSFKVTTNEVGSIDIASSPSGASIFVDGIANGTTPNTVDNIIAGSHKIILRKTGYDEWGKIVTVTDGETTDVSANLNAVSAAATTAPTNTPAPVVTTRPTTARTTAKSTVKVPTSWVDTPTTTAASPVDPVIVIGTIGLAFLALRKP